MTAILKSLELEHLSIEDRVSLVTAIWDSIAISSGSPPLTDELRAELDQRFADHLARPDDVVPWEEAKAAALARMPQ